MSQDSTQMKFISVPHKTEKTFPLPVPCQTRLNSLLQLSNQTRYIKGTAVQHKSHHASHLKKRKEETTISKVSLEMPRSWLSLNFVATEHLIFPNITKVYFLLYFLLRLWKGFHLGACIESGFYCGHCRLKHHLGLLHLSLVPHRNLR